MKSLKELCLNSGSGKNFSPERMHRIEETLIEDHRSDLPWYLPIIVAIGAWVASCFFLGSAIVLIGWQDEHKTTIGFIGVALLIIAVAVGRQKWGVFVGQCALAVSLAGQAMIYYGFVNEHFHPLGMATVISIGLAALLYVAYPNFLSRLMTCFAALQLTLFWIYAGDNGELFSGAQRVQSDLSQLILFYWAFHLAAICWCFLRPRHSVLFAPLGYALIASLAAWQVENLSNVWVRSTEISYSVPWVEWMFFHLRTGLTALTLFGVSIWAAGGIFLLREKASLFMGLALALAALVWLGSGGVLLALLLMLLGFSLQNRAVLGLGIILFPIFLAHYYYNLNLDLLAKSGVLIGSGMVVLLLRAGLARWVFADLKEAA
jgi:uncharacterized membrane protein